MSQFSLFLAANLVPAPKSLGIVVLGANRRAAQRLNASFVYVVSSEDQALALSSLTEFGCSMSSAVRPISPAHARTSAPMPHVGPGRIWAVGP